MAIDATYPAPVIVNGYSCRNCTDVSRAEHNIDPANPLGDPFGVNDGKNGAKAQATAERNHFSPEARNIEALKDARKRQVKQSQSVIAAAYGGAGAGVTPGQFVNVAA